MSDELNKLLAEHYDATFLRAGSPVAVIEKIKQRMAESPDFAAATQGRYSELVALEGHFGESGLAARCSLSHSHLKALRGAIG